VKYHLFREGQEDRKPNPFYIYTAGGACFETVLNFRVHHLSRCVTGGAFDFDLLIENCKSASST
jgi:hypothetical protein